MITHISFTSRVLFGALVFLLFFSGIPKSDAKDFYRETVNIQEFVQALERSRAKGRGVILDVRTPGEYATGHTPKSVNIDFYAKNFRPLLNALDKDEVYFVYCRSGNRSGHTLKLMETIGFKYVYNLSGGWSRHHNILSSLNK